MLNLKYEGENWIEEVLNDREVESLEEYLRERKGVKLFKDDQKKLREFITEDFDKMIKKLQNDRHKKKSSGAKTD